MAMDFDSQQPRGVHLVGSIPLSSTEEVLRTASAILGGRLRRIPDGETGIRYYWIGWQSQVFDRNPNFEKVPPPLEAYAPLPLYKLRSPGASNTITFDTLGYAAAALDSYAVFSRLKQSGGIPANYRFQVSLPTPLAVVAAFVIPKEQAEVEPAYEVALLRELELIVTSIPQDELAIQWDVAIEFGALEGVMPTYLKDVRNDILERLIRLGNHVPVPVELGYHLCYGDAEHKHFKEPEDASKLVDIANAISAGVSRPVNWIHMPVPRNRTDDAYFEPLRNLHLQPGTELYLGLVHFTDKAEGAQKRIAAAQRFVTDFGVATECGMGRRPPATIPELLNIHRDVSTPVQ